MTKKDIPRVTRMLQKHLRQFKLYLEIDEKYVENWLLPRKDVMYSYISDTTDQFLSFYSIPYVHVESGSVVKQAYTFYNVGSCLKDAIVHFLELQDESLGQLKDLQIIKNQTNANMYRLTQNFISEYLRNSNSNGNGNGNRR